MGWRPARLSGIEQAAKKCITSHSSPNGPPPDGVEPEIIEYTDEITGTRVETYLGMRVAQVSMMPVSGDATNGA